MMDIKVIWNDRGNPPGKLADVELGFADDSVDTGNDVVTLAHPLAGLKLAGFAVWERRGASGRVVTFPARQYAVNGMRHTFNLLRPAEGGAADAGDGLKAAILQAVADHEAQVAAATALKTRLFRHATDGTCDLIDDATGERLIENESVAVCEAVQHALAHPEMWTPTEAYEVASGIRLAAARRAVRS